MSVNLTLTDDEASALARAVRRTLAADIADVAAGRASLLPRRAVLAGENLLRLLYDAPTERGPTPGRRFAAEHA